MPLVKAQCTNCKGTLEIDENKDAAICPYCGTAFIVEKAVQQYIIHNGLSEEKYLENGIMQLSLEKYENAFDTFSKMTAEYPGNWKGWLGLSLARNGKNPSRELSISEDKSYNLLPSGVKDKIGNAEVYSDSFLKNEYETKKKTADEEIEKGKERIRKYRDTMDENEKTVETGKEHIKKWFVYLKRKYFIMRCIGAILVILALLFAIFFIYFNAVKLQGGTPGIFWSLVPISVISGPTIAVGIVLIERGLKNITKHEKVVAIVEIISSKTADNEQLRDKIEHEQTMIKEKEEKLIRYQTEYERERNRTDHKTLSYYVEILKNSI